MAMELTSEQIEELHERHDELVGEMREIARRLDDINLAFQSKQLAEGVSFDEIGRPINERP